MAGAAAEAGTAEKAAESLIFYRPIDHIIAKIAAAGCTHARNRLPGDGFAA